jgi:hypothetical protein
MPVLDKRASERGEAKPALTGLNCNLPNRAVPCSVLRVSCFVFLVPCSGSSGKPYFLFWGFLFRVPGL